MEGGFILIHYMNQDIAKAAFEQIDNQILRLLLYFGGVVIVTLSTALVYLWNSWRAEQRDRISIDKENAAALNSVANKLENFEAAVNDLQRLVNQKNV